jgi:hypothetical protein
MIGSCLTYSHTDELVTYQFSVPQTDFKRQWTTKNNNFYFGGGERNRKNSFLEFVWRPKHEIRAKSTSLGFDNRVSFKEHNKLMKNSFFSIVIADEDYNKASFITPRIYECWMSDVVAFVEPNYDPKQKVISKNSDLRVNSYPEMLDKMNEILKNEPLHENIIKEQRARLTTQILSGQNILNIIK